MDTQEIDNIETAVNQDYPPHDPDRTATLDGYDDDSTPDNGSRAEAAAAAVTINLDDESEIADLISNLLHLAHSLDMDPGGIMRSAIINFHAEAGPLDHPEPAAAPDLRALAAAAPDISQALQILALTTPTPAQP